jgi:aminoglycoside phosphotransferase (APT) family kinase protein
MIVGSDGTVLALLDWELCTLGDPLADLGLLHVYWSRPAGIHLPQIPAAGAISGMPSIDRVVRRYGERSGRDLSHLPFYVAFGYWKLALILEGVYTRFRSGAYGDVDAEHEAFGTAVITLLELAEQTLDDYGIAR